MQNCTDAEVIPKPEWPKRKQDYILHVATASASARLVSASDKLHNARAILRDYREIGESLWPRFNGGKDGTLWYYRALVNAFLRAGEDDDSNQSLRSLVNELDRVVNEIESLSSQSPAK